MKQQKPSVYLALFIVASTVLVLIGGCICLAYIDKVAGVTLLCILLFAAFCWAVNHITGEFR